MLGICHALISPLTYPDLLPAKTLINQHCHREATRLLSLPPHHPLFPDISSQRRSGPHPTPIEAFKAAFNWTNLSVETVETKKKDPSWTPPFLIHIPTDKAEAILADLSDHRHHQIYTDGSSLADGVGSSAILFDNLQESSSLQFHLGTPTHHTVFEAELVGILLAIHLIDKSPSLLDVTIALDNKAAIAACLSRSHRPGHHIALEIQRLTSEIILYRPSLLIQLRWVPGHVGIVGNDRADSLAKSSASGTSSSLPLLPNYLHFPLPVSVSALKAAFTAQIQLENTAVFRRSIRYNRLKVIDSSAPSRRYWKISRDLTKRRASILIQLRTGHIPLNSHLHRINKVPNPSCPHCTNQTETVFHYLLSCPHFRNARDKLRSSIPRNLFTIKHLLHNPTTFSALWKYIDETKRLSETFGSVNSVRQKTRSPK